MKKELIKPLLVDFEEVHYRNDLNKLEDRIIKAHGQRIEKAFAATGLGKFDNDYLHQILKGDLAGIRKDIVNVISKVLDPEYLSNEIENNVNIKLKSLERETRDLLSTIDRNGMHNLKEYISVSGTGKITVSNEDKKRLKESHSTYLTTEEGIELYELHKAACNAINAFVDAMGDKMGFSDALQAFGLDDNDKIIPVIFDYE